MLSRCVEETEVLDVHRVPDEEIEEEDGADEGEGEGEDTGAGEQEQGGHISVGQPNVVVLTNIFFVLATKRKKRGAWNNFNVFFIDVDNCDVS